jgi:hypothetical protein
MPIFKEIKPGVRLRGLDPSSTAEVVQIRSTSSFE